MSAPHVSPSDVAFSPAVKAIQRLRGSREAYSGPEADAGWPTEIDDNLAAFLAAQTSIFLATASAEGQPTIQHRGGPPGFLHVLDKTTIAFANFAGNRQFITLGNLSENPKVHMFVLDYVNRQRVKIWGEARVIDDDPALLEALMPRGYRARPEQAILIKVKAWNTNCRQHLPQKFDAADVKAALELRETRIAELEAEVAALKGVPVPGA